MLPDISTATAVLTAASKIAPGEAKRHTAEAFCDTVEYHLENDEAYEQLEPSARRRLARIWGVVYIYDPNEVPDEGDTNAVNPTLAVSTDSNKV